MPAPRHDSEETDNAKNKIKKPNQGDPESEDDDAGSEGGASEYEIEEVLDAKRGYFPEGRMGYFVKWKGYGPEENSWVDEMDSGNAQDLIDEFWRKNPHKKKGAMKKGTTEKKTTKKTMNSSMPPEDSDIEEVSSSSKKRSRKSVSQRIDSEDEMEVDEPLEKPAAKKAKKNSNQPSKNASVSKKNNRSETPDVQDKPFGNMDAYKHLSDWEGLVKKVDTVEQADKHLLVYFTLNSGESVMEKSTVCRKRFPQKLLQFYESNLKWRTAEETDSS